MCYLHWLLAPTHDAESASLSCPPQKQEFTDAEGFVQVHAKKAKKSIVLSMSAPAAHHLNPFSALSQKGGDEYVPTCRLVLSKLSY